jgi:tryptophanyl-tRNA synthetase
MYTDPTRLRATDPGHVEGNPVFMYHDAFNPNVDEVNDLKERYVKGAVGDVEVKKKLAAAIQALLEPFRERRAHYEANPKLVLEALDKGSAE